MKFIIFQMKGPTSGGVTGGAEKYSEELAKVIISMGYEVEIYCGRDKDEQELPKFEERLDKIKVRRFDSPFHFLPLSIFSMHWYYLTKARRNTDYIIENQSVIPMFASIYNKTLFTIIHHLTGKDYIRKQGYIKGIIGIFLEDLLMPFLYRKQNVLTVSRHSKRRIIAAGFKADKISIIPPIVENLAKNIIYENKRKNIISYIGRYTGKGGNKRVDHVIEVMLEVLKTVPDAKLIIGGSMKKKEELIALINQYHLQDVVEFRGFLTDEEKADLLSQSKIFASPSYQEGFGITYIEAHAFGTPVVGYEIEELDTVPEDSGIMVKKDDKHQLAQAIVRLLQNETDWQEMSAGAVRNAEKYGVEKVRAEYREYLSGLLKAKQNL